MSHLNQVNVKQCVSLLREFVDRAQALNSKKGMARLALDQLLRVNAGSDNGLESRSRCFSRPRVEGLD